MWRWQYRLGEGVNDVDVGWRPTLAEIMVRLPWPVSPPPPHMTV
jgi:hypothetical protein